MKASVYSKSETGKVLEIGELEQPAPSEHEVLLRVRAASVNPLDWRMKSARPGVDVAGEIVAVGKGVQGLRPGDAVFGAAKGAFAEYACALDSKLALKPEAVSFEQAASVPIAGLTALQALRNKARVQMGQKVLINGAAGGVGTFAVQIAKAFGAHVTGVCSTKNVEFVRSLGADCVIDYTREDFTQKTERYDLLLDNVGNRKLAAMKRVLRPKGRCVIVGAPKKMSAVFAWLLKVFTRSWLLRENFQFLIANINRDDLATFAELITAGKVTPMIDRRYPLSETADALAYAEEGHARAKVVIRCDL
jgi:NADPH:quinone reductase-like Zn-dependent oxidoreductase